MNTRSRLAVSVLALSTLLTGALLGAAPAGTPAAPATATAPARGRGMPVAIDQPTPKTGSWMTRHNGFVDMAKKGDIDLYFEGDSITDMFGNSVGKPIWTKEFGGWKVGDFGIGGDTIQNVLWRLQNGEIDVVKPKVIVLMIGTNNSGNASAEEIAKGVKAIVDLMKEKQPQAKILLLAIFPRNATATDPIRIKLNAANEIIAKLDDGKQVKYMNINDKFLDKDGTLTREIMADLLHPTLKGYQIWADAIKPQLTEWLGAPAAAAATAPAK